MKALLLVEEAISRVLDGVAPRDTEHVPLAECLGRVLAEPLSARRSQPPRDVSAMDGYAVRAADVAELPADLTIIGTAPAGHPFVGRVGPREAVRIFTGAVLPGGADAILLQEDAERVSETRVVARSVVRAGQHIRRIGLDFEKGAVMLPAATRLGMRQLALAAALDHATLPVHRKPLVAIIANGDELVLPGNSGPEDSIVASNSYGIAGLVESLGGAVRDLGIVADDKEKLASAIDATGGADILVTLGGASVGDHDFAREVLAARGMELGFWRIAMRPGKPLIFGRLGETRVLGLPGNPVSSLVCSLLFLRPLVEKMLGLAPVEHMVGATLGGPVRANDGRQDYLRADIAIAADGTRIATAFDRQDSSMLSTFARAGCLIVRPPHAPAGEAGEPCSAIILP